MASQDGFPFPPLVKMIFLGARRCQGLLWSVRLRSPPEYRSAEFYSRRLRRDSLACLTFSGSPNSPRSRSLAITRPTVEPDSRIPSRSNRTANFSLPQRG
jgi:hypothetical protein